MKSSNVKQYAQDAFRFYAKWGTLNKYIQKISEEAYEGTERNGGSGGAGNPTEAAVVRAEKAMEVNQPALEDLRAAEKTLERLCIQQPEIALAVQLVYMLDPENSPTKGEMKARILRASMKIPASERSVYYWLGIAIQAFARERGLRVDC